MSVKSGEKTTEWKALIAGILTTVAGVGTVIMEKDLFNKDSLLYVVIASIVAVAGIVGVYIKKRSDVKVADASAVALTEAAEKSSEGK